MRTAFGLALVYGVALLPALAADARAKEHKAPAPRAPHVRSGAVKVPVPRMPHYNFGSVGRGMSGGSLRAYEQVWKEGMVIQQQQYVIQQQRYMLQQLQNQAKNKGKANSPATSTLNHPNAESINHYHRKTYNHGPVDPNFKPKSDASN